MKVLVLGFGSMGSRHARNAARAGHEVMVWDPAVQLSGTPSGTAGYAGDGGSLALLGSERAARLSKPQAVVIATPAASHAALLAFWDKAGVPVFVEKPLALSVGDYYQPRGTLDRSPLAVGYSLRFQPHVRAMRQWMSVLTGPPWSWKAVCWLACDGTTWPGTDYASTLLECSHEIDLAAYLLGSPTAYGAMASDDGRTWNLDLKCGETPVYVHLSTASQKYERWTSVSDTAGHRVWWGWHVPTGYSVLSVSGMPDVKAFHDVENVYAAELRAFLNGEWMASDGCEWADAMAVLRVCDRALLLSGQAAVSKA